MDELCQMGMAFAVQQVTPGVDAAGKARIESKFDVKDIHATPISSRRGSRIELRRRLPS